jgi:hypothetical protein
MRRLRVARRGSEDGLRQGTYVGVNARVAVTWRSGEEYGGGRALESEVGGERERVSSGEDEESDVGVE